MAWDVFLVVLVTIPRRDRTMPSSAFLNYVELFFVAFLVMAFLLIVAFLVMFNWVRYVYLCIFFAYLVVDFLVLFIVAFLVMALLFIVAFLVVFYWARKVYLCINFAFLVMVFGCVYFDINYWGFIVLFFVALWVMAVCFFVAFSVEFNWDDSKMIYYAYFNTNSAFLVMVSALSARV